MTTKQIRDLQAFAVELAKEGRHDAAKEVLALISRRHSSDTLNTQA